MKAQQERDNFKGKTQEVNFVYLLFSFGGGWGRGGAFGVVDMENHFNETKMFVCF